MSTDEYVPSEGAVKLAWATRRLFLDSMGEGDPSPDAVYNAEIDRFLARVRRDAAREALNGLAGAMMDTPGIGPGTKTHRARMRVDVVTYRDIHYPEGAEHG